MNIALTAIAISLLPIYYMLIIIKCLNTFFVPTPNYLFCFYCYFIQVYLEIYTSFPPYLFLNMVLIFLVTSLSYAESFKQCAIFSIVICAVWLLAGVILHMSLNFLNLDDESGIVDAVITQITILIFYSVTVYYHQKGMIMETPGKYDLRLLMMPVGGTFILCILFISNSSITEIIRTYVYGILLLLINYVIFIIFKLLPEYVQYKNKTLLYEQQLNLYSQQIQEQETQNAEIRRLHHDMKEHLTCLFSMAMSNKREAVTEYIGLLLKSDCVKKVQEVSRSGNVVVDSLVNYKYSIAQREEIDFSVNIFIPTILSFRNGNLTIILGNLLENALDACRQIKDGQRWIELQMYYQKGMLSIVVLNTYEGERVLDNQNKYQTTKKDKNNHGFGLYSVKQAASEYHGEVITQMKEGIFKAVVLMYEKQEN